MSAPGFELLADQTPQVWDAFAEMVEVTFASDALPSGTLELCRRRITQILGGDPTATRPTLSDPQNDPAAAPAELVSLLASWPTSPDFDDTQRACLGVAEQMVLDVQGIDADLANPVVARVGERGWTTLVVGCGLAEAMARAGAVLGDAGSTGT